jgi:hypothetical protein
LYQLYIELKIKSFLTMPINILPLHLVFRALNSSQNSNVDNILLDLDMDLSTDFLIDGCRIGLFRGARNTTGWWELGTQITPRGWIFWTMIFYNLKNSGQDLSNEGSIFFLSSVEVGH